jgi:potassium efflux system protein
MSCPSRYLAFMRGLCATALSLLLLGALPGLVHGATAPVAAATATASSAPEANADALLRALNALPEQISEDMDDRELLTQVYAIGSAAEQLASQRTQALSAIDARIEGMGPAPEKGAPAEPPDVAAQRKALAQERSELDASLKLARLVSVNAQQRASEITRQRRALFQAEITQRVDSPLGTRFWRQWWQALPMDLSRLQALGDEARDALREAFTPERRLASLWHLALALLLIVVAPWLTDRLLPRLAQRSFPEGRLRRSLLAAASVLLYIVCVSAGLHLAWTLPGTHPEAHPTLADLEAPVVSWLAFGTFVAGLGHVVLARRRPSWRLPPMGDALAARLSPYPWAYAAVAVLGGVLNSLHNAVGASLAAEVTTHALTALGLALITWSLLRHVRPATRATAHAAAQASTGNGTTRPPWIALITTAASLAMLATLVLMALGFVALSSMVARQMLWAFVVFTTTYVVFALIEDLCAAVIASQGPFGQRLQQSLGVPAQRMDQGAVLLAGVLRVVVCFYMVIALMAPFGTGPGELLNRGVGVGVGGALQLGEFSLAPRALLSALAIAVAGFVLIRILQRWLRDTFFPKTSLDTGIQTSTLTLLSYVGGVAVIASALAGLGIGVERIAWVASALSVGIGFGLQAIVQNFISGIILLAERPVKVGDWVRLGDTEGDVRRVNVRATEIQLSDRSTVIVPNSEFITKSVRNMTQAGAPGRVLLQLPAPLDTDARQMRALLLEALQAHPSVLETPGPSVTLEGIQNGTLSFLVIGYVVSPRSVSGVRSDLLFSILEALRAAGLSLSPPATTSVPTVQNAG